MFADCGRINELPVCVVEHQTDSGEWVTHPDFKNLSLEEGRNIVGSNLFLSFRLRVRQQDGLYKLDGSVADPDYDLAKKTEQQSIHPQCHICQCDLPARSASIVTHFKQAHNRQISEGEANRLATRSSFIASTLYTESDNQGKSPREVGGGASFSNRSRF